MKDINKYIVEKLHINKGKKFNDNVFINMHDAIVNKLNDMGFSKSPYTVKFLDRSREQLNMNQKPDIEDLYVIEVWSTDFGNNISKIADEIEKEIDNYIKVYDTACGRGQNIITFYM